jgi:hypothetical protein
MCFLHSVTRWPRLDNCGMVAALATLWAQASVCAWLTASTYATGRSLTPVSCQSTHPTHPRRRLGTTAASATERTGPSGQTPRRWRAPSGGAVRGKGGWEEGRAVKQASAVTSLSHHISSARKERRANSPHHHEQTQCGARPHYSHTTHPTKARRGTRDNNNGSPPPPRRAGRQQQTHREGASWQQS